MADLEGAVLDAPIETGDAQDEGFLGDDVDIESEGAEESAEDPDTGEDDSEPVDEEADAEGDKEPVTPDGRKMPDGLKKAIAGLKATSPEVAKQIKQMFYADQEYRAVFAKPEDAVSAKAMIEEIGGSEGIQALNAEREEWAAIDKGFAEGSPEFVKGIADASPEGFTKTAVSVMNEFASRSPEQYGYYANNVALNTLANSGISMANISAAYQKYGDGSGSETPAQSLLAEIHGALSGLKKSASDYEQKRTDPREEKLNQRENDFEQKRRGDFEGGVATTVEKYLADKMKPEIDRIVGTRKIDPAAMTGYQKMVRDEVARRLGEVPGFASQLEAHYRSGNAEKSAAYVQAQYNRILPEAVKVIAPYLRNIKAGPVAVPREAGQRVAGPGEVTLKEMPDHGLIDWDRTTVADVMQGRAVLTNGKKASGWV